MNRTELKWSRRTGRVLRVEERTLGDPARVTVVAIKPIEARCLLLNPQPAAFHARRTRLTEQQLLAQCSGYGRASGRAGRAQQNKFSVRLRHIPTGTIVIAEESRSQHENKAKALKRLWRGLFLHLRDEISTDMSSPESIAALPDYAAARGADGRLNLAARDPRFWPAVGVALDLLTACEGRVADAAVFLGISTGNLIDFLQTDPKVWQEANRVRANFGQKTLR